MKPCECGCGEPAPLARQTDRKRGYVKGQPHRFIAGHSSRGRPFPRETAEKAWAATRGRPLSAEHRRRISEAKCGGHHPLWKGDDASYGAIYNWLRRHYPKAGRCEWCGNTGPTGFVFLAGGHAITRNRDDYAELCVRCDRSRRFAAKVGPPDENGCLPWMGAIKEAAGYGNFGDNGRTVSAHRFAWEQVHGPIPEGHEMHHLCGHPWCVNVEHLRLVTPAQHVKLHASR